MEELAMYSLIAMQSRPVLKWAGGKTQLLKELLPRVPAYSGKYLEPFFGGGALFFATLPKNAVLSDSNPELMNVYRQLQSDPEAVIACLQGYENTEEMYYAVRAQNWQALPPSQAAARTIYLNRTCFNGLYRVNSRGVFNAPYGHYENPKICDEPALLAASAALRDVTLLCADYLEVLEEHARPGDFVYLDPPGLFDGSGSALYTKDQFREEDHRRLAAMALRLRDRGCHVLLTSASHPLLRELYAPFSTETVQSSRSISRSGASRKGEDLIVSLPPKVVTPNPPDLTPLPTQISQFPAAVIPGTRQNQLEPIWQAASRFSFSTVWDPFSGSGAVSYLFKAQGKQVLSSDHMAMATIFAKAMIENSTVTLSPEEAASLLLPPAQPDDFVTRTFPGLYFSDADNATIDTLRQNIAALEDPARRDIALAALLRACLRARPRGSFAQTGIRPAPSLETLFLAEAESINRAVFDNGQPNQSLRTDALAAQLPQPDLIYLDPPTNTDWVRRYHFAEGLARDWQNLTIQKRTKTRRFPTYPSAFASKTEAAAAYETLFRRYPGSIFLLSYSPGNPLPADQIVALLSKYKVHVEKLPTPRKREFLILGY